MLAAALPADTAEQAARHDDQTEHLRKHLARSDAAERALISELETAADPADPAAQAYRARIRARYAELYDQRTRTEADLKAAEAAAAEADDPTLLDDHPRSPHSVDPRHHHCPHQRPPHRQRHPPRHPTTHRHQH
jgi:hypothetical protein